MCGEYSREDANGVAQVCFMGVINPLDPRVETAEEIRDELAARRRSTSRSSASGATDDCGFSPFSRDVKPKHGSPDFARDIAMQKIAARWRASRSRAKRSGSDSRRLGGE